MMTRRRKSEKKMFRLSAPHQSSKQNRAFMAQLMGYPLLKLITDLEMFAEACPL